ncbi:hypothetical protein LX16_2055 [Stackebrandtia albiflava]|uniref:Uncharacterized protein n=1 Tax=Stackebrandtia albiflava TaxID=406432 RepID=A0A562VEK9_9ACTN|nr:hypothetical protein [Stackebrandtia albiflava]TWJ16326.1 hypothetical protein LX16_2055 [Stackebrandtia albiflava]
MTIDSPTSAPPAPHRTHPIRELWPPLVAGILIGAILVAEIGFLLVPALQPETGRMSPALEQEHVPLEYVIVDDSEWLMHPGTRCAWPRLGSPWEDVTSDWDHPEYHNMGGQIITLSDNWGATFLVGQLNKEYVGYSGPDDLKDANEDQVDHKIENYYHDSDGNPLNPEESDVDTWRYDFGGHAGVVSVRTLTWDEPQVGDTSELLINAVIDVDGDRAVGVAIALPASQQDQYMVVMSALLQMRFVDA